MKNIRTRIIIIAAWVVAIVVIVTLFLSYTSLVSEKLYDEAKQNFSEVYEQVDRNFIAFMDDTWKNLGDWGPYINDLNDEAAVAYIKDRQSVWGFSRFLFMNEKGDAVATDGHKVELDFVEDPSKLLQSDKHIMAELGLDTTAPETIFASHAETGTYHGFEYDIVAVTYTNEALANTIKTEAFSGTSIGFIVYPDGKIALSTQEGGNVFSNYLTYLKAGSNLSAADIEQLEKSWEAGEKGVIVCDMDDTDFYISYRPLGYKNYVLLGVVPTDAVSGSLRGIQNMTIDVLMKIFAIVAALIVLQIYISLRGRLKKSKAEIEYRDVLFDLLSANLDDIFIVIDAKSLQASYVTPNIKRLLGVTTDAVKKDIRVLDHALADQNLKINKEVLSSIKTGERYELLQEWINQEDGSQRWFREAIYHMQIQGEEKYILIMSDRTEDRIMAQSLEEALATAKNANLAKSQFLSNMSHDIRTPMNAIMGFTNLLEANADDPDRVREYIRKISSSSKHLLNLINDVLDMSKIESGKTELTIVPFSFAELLEEVSTIMAPQATAKDQTFEVRMEGRPNEFLMGDKLRINQILINLLSNAVKYTPIGGNIEFVIQERPSKNPHYSNIRFIIKDDGMGMSEEYLKVIFDPFTRETNSVVNSIQGTGLGMAITKNIVDLMGGSIRVESELGVGTTFEVDLSFAVADHNDKERFWVDEPDFKVLVVDDEERVCLDIESALEEESVTVEYSTDGKAAVDMVKRAHETGNDFDVVLLDWKMPGQNGVETSKQIREIVPEDTIIIVLTAYDWADIEKEAVDAGVNGFLAKPFFVTSLSQKLKQLANNERIEDEDAIDVDALRGLNILAAEDNDLSAEMLIERLDMEGARVNRARNGQEAVEMFEASEPGEYDLVLMDVQMPVMGGHDATRAIRASQHPEGKTVPIFAMTANVFAEDVQEALDAGMNAHIPKPIDMNELKRVANREVNRKEDSGV